MELEPDSKEQDQQAEQDQAKKRCEETDHQGRDHSQSISGANLDHFHPKDEVEYLPDDKHSPANYH